MRKCRPSHVVPRSGHQVGFTLVETLVAVAVLLIAIAAPLTLIQRSLSSANNSKDNLTAANLARDALEYVKNVRDTNLMNDLEPWTTSLELCLDQTCTVDTTRPVLSAFATVSPGSSDPLRYDTSTNRYGYDAGDETPYTREATIVTIVPDQEYRVEVEVTWTNRGIPHTYRVGQNLFKLVSASGCSSPAVNGLHVGIDPTDPNYGFLDCGMLLHYTFDSADISGTTVRDISGFGNDGTYFGGTPSTAGGQRGEALSLDGNDDKVLGTKMDMFGDFTMTTWVKASLLPHGAKGIAGKQGAYKYKGVDSGVEYNVKAPGGADYIAPAAFDGSSWYHLALSFDSSTAGASVVRYYMNGTLITTDTTTGNAPVQTADRFVVGCWSDSTGPCFTAGGAPTSGGHLDGLIDDVRIYGRTLDEWEIQALADNSW